MFDLTQVTVNKIKSLMNVNKEFTAFDITTALRSDHPSETIFHYEVRPIVHQEMSYYTLTYQNERDFSLHSNGPIVYSPVLSTDNLKKTFPITTQSTTNPPVTDPDPDQFAVDGRGRLLIRKKFLDELDNPTLVSVDKSFGQQALLIEPGNSSSANNVLRVDRYGNVKLSRKTLVDYGFDLSEPFNVYENNGYIVVDQ